MLKDADIMNTEKNNENNVYAKRALFYTNSAYLFADIANTMAMEAESNLAQLKQAFRQEEKMKFKRAKRIAADSRKATADVAKELYNITDVDNACIDADYLTDIFYAVISRTGESDESQQEMLELIRTRPDCMKLGELLKKEV